MRYSAFAAAVVAAIVLPGAAWAGASCKANPKNEWMSEADARAKIAGQGYKIDKFKIDGNCYEIYGSDKDGKNVEIYFDTKSLDVVKMESK